MKAKSLFLLLFGAACCLWSGAKAQEKVEQTLTELAQQPEMSGSSISFLAVDIQTKKDVAAYDAERLLSPASVQKLITTATALEVLGPQFRFSTILALEGTVSNRTLSGNVVVIGGGDPTFGSRYGEMDFGPLMQFIFSKIRGAGIDSIDGSILVDDSYFLNYTPGTYIWKDLGNYYAAAASGLNINHNEYTVELASEAAGTDVRVKNIAPAVPGLRLQSRAKASTIQADMAYIYGAPFSPDRIIRGTIPQERNSFSIRGSLPNPPYFAAYHIYRTLLEGGVAVSGDYNVSANYRYNRPQLDTLAVFYSAPLAQIVAVTNKRSDNLFAEALLKQIGLSRGEGSTEAGIDAIREIWKTRTAVDFKILDGSGLSPGNALSASQLVGLLVSMYGDVSLAPDFVLSLPMAGVEGTVKSFGSGTGLANNARVKSGSMEGVRSYAGYITGRSGREMAFAFIVNHYGFSPAQMRKKMEAVLVELYLEN